MGQAPDGAAYDDSGEGWPLLAGAGDFGGGVPAPKRFTREAAKPSVPGDIIMGIRASIGGMVRSDGEYCLGRGVAALRSTDLIDGRFLWHWLEYSREVLASKPRGATFKQVNRDDIGEHEIPVPPRGEQRHIAEVLDLAETLRANRRAALAQIDGPTQATFLEMFGDPVANSRGWWIRRVVDVSDVQGGAPGFSRASVGCARGPLPQGSRTSSAVDSTSQRSSRFVHRSPRSRERRS